MIILRRSLALFTLVGLLTITAVGSMARVSAAPTSELHHSAPAVTASGNVGFNLLGDFGWDTTVVAMNDQYAYVTGWSDTLSIYDISAPTQPVLRSRIKLPGKLLENVRLEDGRLYGFIFRLGELGAESDLVVVDVHDATAPTLLGVYDTPDRVSTYTFDVEGTHVYLFAYGQDCSVTCSHNLLILDASKPHDIRQVSETTIAVAGYEPNFNIVGTTLYIGASNNLTILEVSNPAEPRVVHRLTGADDEFYNVRIAGRLLIAWYNNAIRIYDLSDADAPRWVGRYEASTRIVGSRGQLLYIITHDKKLLSLDVSQSSSPVLIGQVTLPGENDYNKLFVSSRSAYVYDNWFRTYLAYDIQQSLPVSQGQVNFSERLTTTEVEVNENLVYNPVGSELQILDTTTATTPTKRGTYGVAGWAYLNIQRIGDRIYAEREQSAPPKEHAIDVIDVHDPDHPVSVEVLRSNGYVGALFDGHRSYTGGSGVAILELSTTANPKVLGVYTGGPEDPYPYQEASVWGVDENVLYTSGNYTCFRCPYNFAFVFLDIQNPASPQPLSSIKLPGLVRDVEIRDDFAYIVVSSGNGANSELMIVNVSDPKKPIIVGQLNFERAYMNSLEVEGQRVFLSAVGATYVVDVSNPGQPTLRTTYGDLGAIKIEVSGERLYRFGLGDVGSHGMQVYDIVPLEPVVYAPFLFR